MVPALVVLLVAIVAALVVLSRKQGGAKKKLAAPARASALPAGRAGAAGAAGKTGPQPPAAAKVNWLVGIGGEVEGKAFFIGGRTATIGRGPENFVQLTSPTVSRVHCQVSGGKGILRVTDMSSKHGLKIRGEEAERGELVDGDELEVGDCRFRYHSRGDFEDDAMSERKRATDSMLEKTVTRR